MGRLGDWDKVERKKRPIKFTKQDEFWEYFKMFIYILLQEFIVTIYLYRNIKVI